jgi:hypothetical protein
MSATRLPTIVLAAFGLLASLLAISMPAGAAGLAPTGAKGGAYFRTSPEAPLVEGQTVTLAGMFSSKVRGKNVTFYV